MSTLKVQNIQHTNGTSGIAISSGGVITQPTIPCCMVQLTTSNAQDTSNPYTTTSTDIRFDSILINQGNCYSESTGRFTVPIAGVYEINCQFLSNATSATNKQIVLQKNGSAVQRGYHGVDNQHVEMHVHALVDCVSDDYLTIQLEQGEIYIDGGGSYSAFTVRLVG